MLKLDKHALAELEREHPGIRERIRRFEARVVPPCPFCHAFDTAEVASASAEDAAYLASATTKMKLLGRGERSGAYYCNACGQFFDRAG